MLNKVGYSQKIMFKSNVDEISQDKLTNDIPKADSIEIKSKKEPPKISTIRLFFSWLSDEQIDGINESKMLPENGKFVMNGSGGYGVVPNFFNFTTGTRKLPEGFEVKKSIFGFATVLPKDSEGFFIQK